MLRECPRSAPAMEREFSRHIEWRWAVASSGRSLAEDAEAEVRIIEEVPRTPDQEMP